MTDENTPAIPDMTDAECATAYRDLRKRANDAGFATVGEWIDEQPETAITEEWCINMAHHEAEAETEYDRLKAQKDAILAKRNDADANKAGGLWYRRWRAAQDELNALRTDRKAVLEEAAAKAKRLIGAGKGDHPNLAIRESNINEAWHILNRALAEGASQ